VKRVEGDLGKSEIVLEVLGGAIELRLHELRDLVAEGRLELGKDVSVVHLGVRKVGREGRNSEQEASGRDEEAPVSDQ